MTDRTPAPVLTLVVVLIVLAAWPPAVRAARGPFAYVSPVPGSRMISPVNNVAVRPGPELDPRSVQPGLLSVIGSESGAHSGALRLSRDGRTLLFDPARDYTLGETVRVRLAAGLRTLAGESLPELAFDFQVASVDPRRMPRVDPERFPDPPLGASPGRSVESPRAALAVGPCDTLLPGIPASTLVEVNGKNPGCYFMAPFDVAALTQANLQILDDLGKPIYQQVRVGASLPVDFKLQPDGRLTYWMNGPFRFMVMDSAYAVVDTFTTGNGYAPDLHELQILPNGHALMMSYDPQPVGMDTVVTGGNPNAIVFGLIVQELDENKDVVFQWRSWDHFKITDGAVSPLTTITGASVDYVHGNSIDLCPDGNLLISSRHMNELTKIDRETGEILWRMGLHAANNQFTFPNDPRGFSHTHDARMLPNGHLTVFDNGNFLSPQYSRALEFELDEENLVATRVWEYRHVPEVYGGFMGNVKRYPDGSTTIGWGGTFGPYKVTELTPEGGTGAEIKLANNWVNYRTFRAPWRMNRFLTDRESLTVASGAVGQGGEAFVKLWNHWDRPVTITCMRTLDPAFAGTFLGSSFPREIAPGETTIVQVTYDPVTTDTTRTRLYIMQVSSDELVAQTVDLTGTIDPNVNVAVSPEVSFSTTARPNPVRARANIEYTLPASGRVQLEVFDVGGRRVAELVRAVQGAGRHDVVWDAAGRDPGLYFYRLRAGGRTAVRKLVVGR